MNLEKKSVSIEKLKTGIEGFDLISNGGLSKDRTTLVAGTSGSAKTVFSCQFLAAGVQDMDEHGVFVTFEESPSDICRNMSGFGWEIADWESKGKWAFVDASPDPDIEIIEIGAYDMGALLARVEYAINKVKAKRLVIDSLGAIFDRFSERNIVRSELFRIAASLKKMGVTSIMTAERAEEYGDIARFRVEEFVVDNVIIMRNVLEASKRRRSIEILKFRGASHQKGEYPFTILPDEGVIIIPLSAMELIHSSSNIRITSGNKELDDICNGGFFRDSIILISGATGTGKTLIATEFVSGGIESGERCLFLGFEESRGQLFRNASGWGRDFERMEQDGKLKAYCEYPESASLEDHLIVIKKMIDAFKPDRIAIDSLSALERVSTVKSFREFVISLTAFIKEKEIAGMFTAVTASLMGGTSITEAHISTITDSIILLRYVETYGEMQRAITVLKMRGSMHDKAIREFNIDGQGLHIGKPFRNVTGILSGMSQHVLPEDVERVGELFKE